MATIKGYIVVNEKSGITLLPTFANSERIAQGLAVQHLGSLGQGKQTWHQWEAHGYKTVPATLNVDH